ncbi:LuxR C-terminal-related transcriptional regulator [Amycolatopsis sp. NPDC049868]|uniref:helix-turn-helix transcriptional regulator n=1 Tax=Amycolatopsis sp. NPDC049868 TaxID=3363934 RepID=UPI0037BB1706
MAVSASDPISQAGLVRCLESQPDLAVVAQPESGQVDCVVAAFEHLNAAAVATLRTLANELDVPIVLIVNEIKDEELLTAVEVRVAAILPRDAVTGTRLVTSVRAVAEEGADIPSDLLGRLIAQTERLHREVLVRKDMVGAPGLTAREIDVLRMVADGLDTNEIALNLRYSERTVKNILYLMTNRLGLRNRSHAVAYAMRAGVI